MDCKRAKALIDEVSGHPVEEAGALEEHLGSCEGCARESKELHEMRAALKSALRYEAPAGFSSRVMEKVRLEKKPFREPGLFRWLWSMPAHLKVAEAAAAVLVVAIGVYSAGFLTDSLQDSANEQAEAGYIEIASLEEIETVPPGSLGDVYLSVKENGNEQ